MWLGLYEYVSVRHCWGPPLMTIKILLVAAILLFGYVAARGRPSAGHLAVRRTLAVLVLLFGIVGVLLPTAVTWLANLVGVGRGTDLVLYVLAVSFLLVTTTLLQRLSDLERRYVLLARQVAIDAAVREEEGLASADASKPEVEEPHHGAREAFGFCENAPPRRDTRSQSWRGRSSPTR